jgi:hypothetical protein
LLINSTIAYALGGYGNDVDQIFAQVQALGMANQNDDALIKTATQIQQQRRAFINQAPLYMAAVEAALMGYEYDRGFEPTSIKIIESMIEKQPPAK